MAHKVEYLGFADCQKLSNDTVEVVVTTEVGPRIIRYAFPGGENILGECPDASVKTELGVWHPYGGHRLWHAPEAMPRSYVPDDQPVEFECPDNLSIRLTQAVEQPTGIRKELEVSLEEEGSEVRIVHRLTNEGLWTVELAPWALTIMNGGGTVIIPQEPYLSHDDYLLPARPMVLWHYTDLTDPRFAIGKLFLRLRTDENLDEPQKIGVANKQGYAAYHRGGTLFIKQFGYEDGLTYPDGGCNCETYTAGSFIELESVGPMHELEPGEAAEYVETWHLFANVELGETDESVRQALDPLLKSIA